MKRLKGPKGEGCIFTLLFHCLWLLWNCTMTCSSAPFLTPALVSLACSLAVRIWCLNVKFCHLVVRCSIAHLLLLPSLPANYSGLHKQRWIPCLLRWFIFKAFTLKIKSMVSLCRLSTPVKYVSARFMGNILSFCQYKNHKLGQFLHTGYDTLICFVVCLSLSWELDIVTMDRNTF